MMKTGEKRKQREGRATIWHSGKCQKFLFRSRVGESLSENFGTAITPRILEISDGIQMESSVSVSSDRNIRNPLWRWSTYFGWNIPTEIRRSIFDKPVLCPRKGKKCGKSHSYWLVRFKRNMSFHFPRVFPLISDRSVWHYGKHPRFFEPSIFHASLDYSKLFLLPSKKKEIFRA